MVVANFVNGFGGIQYNGEKVSKKLFKKKYEHFSWLVLLKSKLVEHIVKKMLAFDNNLVRIQVIY